MMQSTKGWRVLAVRGEGCRMEWGSRRQLQLRSSWALAAFVPQRDDVALVMLNIE